MSEQTPPVVTELKLSPELKRTIDLDRVEGFFGGAMLKMRR